MPTTRSQIGNSPRTVATVLLLALVVALAGCSGNGDDEEAITTTTTAPTTATTSPEPVTTVDDADTEEVLAAYRGFWDAYLVAADPMDPEHPALVERATGAQLEQVQQAFLARLSAGEVIRGSLDLAPEVETIDDDAAEVRDCYADGTGIYDAATGERKDTESGERQLVRASLVRDEGAWKVAELVREGTGCTPA